MLVETPTEASEEPGVVVPRWPCWVGGVLSGLMVVLQVEGVVPKRQRLLMAICSESNLFNEDGCWGDLTGGGGAPGRGLMPGLSRLT